MPIKIVLADDHPIVLDSLEQLFAAEADFSVVARCSNGKEALRVTRNLKPDILILDIRMADMDGLECLRQLRQEKLPTRVVFLTAMVDEDQALEAMRLGVGGVVLKEMPPRHLLLCIRKVHAGGQWLERDSIVRAIGKLLKREDGARRLASLLTTRQTEIVRLVSQDLRNKEIADRLCISEGTIKVHLHNIYQKLNVSSRRALARVAQEKGFI
jgi:DNA-binding NarL/FixJ family response regulator